MGEHAAKILKMAFANRSFSYLFYDLQQRYTVTGIDAGDGGGGGGI